MLDDDKDIRALAEAVMASVPLQQVWDRLYHPTGPYMPWYDVGATIGMFYDTIDDDPAFTRAVEVAGGVMREFARRGLRAPEGNGGKHMVLATTSETDPLDVTGLIVRWDGAAQLAGAILSLWFHRDGHVSAMSITGGKIEKVEIPFPPAPP